MGIKDFSKSVFRTAIAIFIAAAALGGSIWGVVAWQQRVEKRDAQQYEKLRFWHIDVKSHLQFDVSARTKLVDGKLLVALETDGHPAYLSHPALEARNRKAQLFVTFEDNDGFKVYEKAVAISEFSTTVAPDGKKIGLNHQFEDYVGVGRYKSFSRATLRWNLETEIPPPPKPATPVAQIPKPTATDHCAPGLSREERLKRLGQHGVVRQTGPDNYAVGFRELTFFSKEIGGGLLYCR